MADWQNAPDRPGEWAVYNPADGQVFRLVVSKMVGGPLAARPYDFIVCPGWWPRRDADGQGVWWGVRSLPTTLRWYHLGDPRPLPEPPRRMPEAPEGWAWCRVGTDTEYDALTNTPSGDPTVRSCTTWALTPDGVLMWSCPSGGYPSCPPAVARALLALHDEGVGDVG